MWSVGDQVYPVWPDGSDESDIAEVIKVSDDGWSVVRWVEDPADDLVSPIGRIQAGAILKSCEGK